MVPQQSHSSFLTSSRQAVIEDQLRQERLQREELSRQLQVPWTWRSILWHNVSFFSKCADVECGRCGALSVPVFHPDCVGVGRKTEGSRESARGMRLHFNIVMYSWCVAMLCTYVYTHICIYIYYTWTRHTLYIEYTYTYTTYIYIYVHIYIYIYICTTTIYRHLLYIYMYLHI